MTIKINVEQMTCAITLSGVDLTQILKLGNGLKFDRMRGETTITANLGVRHDTKAVIACIAYLGAQGLLRKEKENNDVAYISNIMKNYHTNTPIISRNLREGGIYGVQHIDSDIAEQSKDNRFRAEIWASLNPRQQQALPELRPEGKENIADASITGNNQRLARKK